MRGDDKPGNDNGVAYESVIGCRTTRALRALARVENAFDGFNINDDGNLVIIETKVKNANGRVTNSKWLGEPLSSGNQQMNDEWIEDRLETLVQKAHTQERKEFVRRLADDNGPDAIDITERGGEIQLGDVNQDKIRKELFAYQDGEQTVELASSGLRQAALNEPSLDSVGIVKIGTVFEET